jgi:hypothetical protein
MKDIEIATLIYQKRKQERKRRVGEWMVLAYQCTLESKHTREDTH